VPRYSNTEVRLQRLLNMIIVHGIFKDGKAYTRRSVFGMQLDSKSWKNRESKRVERAKKAKECGTEIADRYLRLRPPCLNKIKLPERFIKSLKRKSKVTMFIRSYGPYWENKFKAVKNVNREVEFTFAHIEEKGISTIAIVHSLDNFNRKTGRKLAMNLMAKALGQSIKTNDDKNIHYNNLLVV